MKKLLMIPIAILSIFTSSCDEEKDEEVMNISYEQLAFDFLGFYPVEARAGDEIILSVSNYDTQDFASHIRIGSHTVEYSIIDDATIRAKIPQGISQGHHQITIRSNRHSVTHDNQILIFGNRF